MFAKSLPLATIAFLLAAAPLGAADDPAALAARAQAVFKANCYRCHGQDGAIEGGLNYVADLGKLVAQEGRTRQPRRKPALQAAGRWHDAAAGREAPTE